MSVLIGLLFVRIIVFWVNIDEICLVLKGSFCFEVFFCF